MCGTTAESNCRRTCNVVLLVVCAALFAESVVVSATAAPSYDTTPATVPAEVAALALRVSSSSQISETVAAVCRDSLLDLLRNASVSTTSSSVTLTVNASRLVVAATAIPEYIAIATSNVTNATLAVVALFTARNSSAFSPTSSSSSPSGILRAALDRNGVTLLESAILSSSTVADATVGAATTLPTLSSAFDPNAAVTPIATPASDTGLGLLIAGAVLCPAFLVLGVTAVKRATSAEEATGEQELDHFEDALAADVSALATADGGRSDNHGIATYFDPFAPTVIPAPELPGGRLVRIRSAHSGLYLTAVPTTLIEQKGADAITDADLSGVVIENHGAGSVPLMRPRIGGGEGPFVYDPERPAENGTGLQVFHCRVVDGLVTLEAVVGSTRDDTVGLPVDVCRLDECHLPANARGYDDPDRALGRPLPGASMCFRATVDPAGQATELVLQDGTHFSCLDIARGSTAVNARVTPFAPTGTPSQRWVLEPEPVAGAPTDRAFPDSNDGGIWCHDGVALPLDARVAPPVAWTPVWVNLDLAQPPPPPPTENGTADAPRGSCRLTALGPEVHGAPPDEPNRSQVFRVAEVDAEARTFTLVCDVGLRPLRTTRGLALGGGRIANDVPLASHGARFALDSRTGELLYRPWHYTRDPVTFARLWAVAGGDSCLTVYTKLGAMEMGERSSKPLKASFTEVTASWCWRPLPLASRGLFPYAGPLVGPLRVRGSYWIATTGAPSLRPGVYTTRDQASPLRVHSNADATTLSDFSNASAYQITPVVDPFGDDPGATADTDRLHTITDTDSGLALAVDGPEFRLAEPKAGDVRQQFRFIRLQGAPINQVSLTCAVVQGTTGLAHTTNNKPIRQELWDPFNPFFSVQLHDTRVKILGSQRLPGHAAHDVVAVHVRPADGTEFAPLYTAATQDGVGPSSRFHRVFPHGSWGPTPPVPFLLEPVESNDIPTGSLSGAFGAVTAYNVYRLAVQDGQPQRWVLAVSREMRPSESRGGEAPLGAVIDESSQEPDQHHQGGDESPYALCLTERTSEATAPAAEIEKQLFVIDGPSGALRLRSLATTADATQPLLTNYVRFVPTDPAQLEQPAPDGDGPPVVHPTPPAPVHDTSRAVEEAAIAAAAGAARPGRVLRTTAPFSLAALTVIMCLAGVAIFVDSRTDSSVPWAIGFAFRTELCNASALAPQPGASVGVAADGVCRRAVGRGLVRPLWLAARCLSPTVAEVRTGRSQDACESAAVAVATLGPGACEGLLINPSWPQLPHVTLHCTSEAEALAALGLGDDDSARSVHVPTQPLSVADNALLQDPTVFMHGAGSEATTVRAAGLPHVGLRGARVVRGGVIGTAADVGADSRMTVSAWVTLSSSASGFIVLTGNQWLSSADGTERVAERLLQFVAGGRDPLPAPWGAFFGLHVDGPTRTVTAVRAAGAAAPSLMRWPVDMLEGSGTNVAAALFDGQPHLLTVRSASRKYGGRYELLVDGKTSQRHPYWQQCGPGFSSANALPPLVAVPSVDAAVVSRPPGLLVGYSTAAAATTPAATTPAMSVGDLYFSQHIETTNDVAATAGADDIDSGGGGGGDSIAVAVVMFVVFAAGAALVVVGELQSVGGVEPSSKVAAAQDVHVDTAASQLPDEDEASEEEDEGAKPRHPGGDQKKTGKAAAKAASRVEFKKPPSSAASGASGSAPSGQAHAVVLDALTMTQTLDIYFTGWSWPATFEVPMSFVIFLPALDLSLDFFSLPALLTPLLQLVAALAFLIVGLRILAADNERFAARAPVMAREAREAREGSSLSDDVTAIPTPNTTLPLQELYTITVPRELLPPFPEPKATEDATGPVELELDDVVVLAAGLQLLLEPDATSAQMLAAGNLPNTFAPSSAGKVLPVRGVFAGCELKYDAEKRQVRCPMAVEATTDAPQRNDEARDDAVNISFRPVRCCPDHPDARLIRALDEPHKRFIEECRTAGRESPYLCVHRGAPFRELRPKACDVDSGFFVCPECTFTVCYNCAALKLGDKIKAFGATKRYEWRDSSLLLGLVVIAVIEAIYVPLLKNAIMVIACHRDFQCTFPGCYRDPTATFGIAVALACVVVLVVGLGVPAAMLKLLLDRKRVLLTHVFGESSSMPFTSVLWYRCDDADWGHVLKYDRSVLKGIYATFELRYMCTQPLLLLGKLALVAGVLASAPESLAQLLTASGVQTTLLLVYVLGQPFIDDQIDRLSKVGSMYQVALLALMALYRTERGVALPILMLVGSALYTAFLAFVIFRVVQSIRHGRLMARVALGPFVAVRQLDEQVLKHLATNAPSELYERTDHAGRTAALVAATLADAASASRMLRTLRELGAASAAEGDGMVVSCFVRASADEGESALAAACKRTELHDEVVALLELLDPSSVVESKAAGAASEGGNTITLASVLGAVGLAATQDLTKPLVLAAVKGASAASLAAVCNSPGTSREALRLVLATYTLWDTAAKHFRASVFDELLLLADDDDEKRVIESPEHRRTLADRHVVWFENEDQRDPERPTATSTILEHVFANDDVAAFDFFADLKEPVSIWARLRVGQAGQDNSLLRIALEHRSFAVLRRAAEATTVWQRAIAAALSTAESSATQRLIDPAKREDVARVGFAIQYDPRASRVVSPAKQSSSEQQQHFGGCSAEIHVHSASYSAAEAAGSKHRAEAFIDIPVALAREIVAVYVEETWQGGLWPHASKGTVGALHLSDNFSASSGVGGRADGATTRVLTVLQRDAGGAIADVRAGLSDRAADISASHPDPDTLRICPAVVTDGGSLQRLTVDARVTFLTMGGLAAIAGSMAPASWTREAVMGALEQGRTPLSSAAVAQRLARIHESQRIIDSDDDDNGENADPQQQGETEQCGDACLERFRRRDARRTWWLQEGALPPGFAEVAADPAAARALVLRLTGQQASHEHQDWEVTTMLQRTQERVAFMRAVYTGDLEAVRKYLTEHPAEASAPVAPCGQVPMHWAAVAGDAATQRLLTYMGASKTAVDVFGCEAQHASLVIAEDVSLLRGSGEHPIPAASGCDATADDDSSGHTVIAVDADGEGAMVSNTFAHELLGHAVSPAEPVAPAAASVSATDQRRLALWVATHRSMCVAAIAARDWGSIPAAAMRVIGLEAVDAGWYAGVIVAVAASQQQALSAVEYGTQLWRRAVTSGRVSMAQLLLELRVPYYRRGREQATAGTTLGHFVSTSPMHAFLTKATLPVGSLALQRDAASWLPLHHAAKRGDVRAIEWLVSEHGADLDARTASGESVEHVGSKHGHVPVVRLYRSRLPSQADAGGRTALHHAAPSAVIQLLADMPDDETDAALWRPAHDGTIPAFDHFGDGWLVFLPAMQRGLERQDAAGRQQQCERLWADGGSRPALARALCSADPTQHRAAEWLVSTLEALEWTAQARNGAKVWWLLDAGREKFAGHVSHFTTEPMEKQLARGRYAFFEFGVPVAGLRWPEGHEPPPLTVGPDDAGGGVDDDGYHDYDDDDDDDNSAVKPDWILEARRGANGIENTPISELNPGLAEPRLNSLLAACDVDELRSLVHHFDVNYFGTDRRDYPLRSLLRSANNKDKIVVLLDNGARVDATIDDGQPVFEVVLRNAFSTASAILPHVTDSMLPSDFFTALDRYGRQLSHSIASHSEPREALAWMQRRGVDLYARTQPPADSDDDYYDDDEEQEEDEEPDEDERWEKRGESVFDVVIETGSGGKIAAVATLLDARVVNDVEYGVTIAHLIAQSFPAFETAEAFRQSVEGAPYFAEALTMRTSDSGELPAVSLFRGGKGDRGHAEQCLLALIKLMPAGSDDSLRGPAVQRPMKLRPRDKPIHEAFEYEEKHAWPIEELEDGDRGWTLLDLLVKFKAAFPTVCQELLDRGVVPLHPDTPGGLVRLFPHPNEHKALRDAIRARFVDDGLDDEFMRSLSEKEAARLMRLDRYDDDDEEEEEEAGSEEQDE